MTLVLFDCDGVLVDTEPVANAIFAESIRALGLPVSDDEALETFTGLSMTRCTEILEQRLGRPLPGEWLDRMQAETFRAFESRGVEAVRGVADVIDYVQERRWDYCVASSGEHEKMALTLSLSGLASRMNDKRFSATEVPRGKPHPDLFLHAAERMGVTPARSVVIEDSVPGVQAAVRAGMAVFGYAERSDPEALRKAGAHVVSRMDELPPRLAAWHEGLS